MIETTKGSAVIEHPLFPGFLVEDIQTTGATIRTLRMGSGPPLLLLHGYPQTHVIWHKIAGRLAEHYAVYPYRSPGLW